MSKIIECIPNFSEGQNRTTLDAIVNVIQSVQGVTLKSIDSGFYAHRTVFTFLGEIDAVLLAAYFAIKKASETIDMREHHGTHPRFGAIDVCPFVALQTGFEEELNEKVSLLAQRVAVEFGICAFLYEKSATIEYRKNLATLRKGGYEALEQKIKEPKWEPDFMGEFYNPKLGGMAIGVRDILVAFNINLNTKDVSIAKRIAEELRESGYLTINEKGEKQRIYGHCKGIKAIGWYIKDFDMVQVSMNIVNYHQTPVHKAFETTKNIAAQYNVTLNGSELIGCIPKICLIDAGKYYSNKIKTLSENDYLEVAISQLGLNSVKPFDPLKHIIL